MAKETLKSVKEQLAEFRKVAVNYVTSVRQRRVINHSSTDIVNKDNKQQVVSIADLISTAKSAEILGYQTVLRVDNGGKTLVVQFIEKVPLAPIELQIL